MRLALAPLTAVVLATTSLAAARTAAHEVDAVPARAPSQAPAPMELEAQDEAEEPAEEAGDLANADVRLILRVAHAGKEIRVALLTKSGTQANAKLTDEAAKAGLTVNLLPAVNPNKPDQVDFQYQVEVKSLEPGRHGFSAQGEAEAKAGVPELLFEAGKDRLTVEVRIEPN